MRLGSLSVCRSHPLLLPKAWWIHPRAQHVTGILQTHLCSLRSNSSIWTSSVLKTCSQKTSGLSRCSAEDRGGLLFSMTPRRSYLVRCCWTMNSRVCQTFIEVFSWGLWFAPTAPRAVSVIFYWSSRPSPGLWALLICIPRVLGSCLGLGIYKALKLGSDDLS